ncbi:MAG: diguanylate cyclase [Pseudomonadota bacterium]
MKRNPKKTKTTSGSSNHVKTLLTSSVAEHAPAPIWACDPDGRFAFTNRRWQQFIRGGEDARPEKQWVASINPEDSPKYQATLEHSLKEHRAMRIDYRVVHKDGSVRWIQDTAEPLLDSDNVFRGLIGTITDVTESKQNLAALRHSHDEAEAQDRENKLIDAMNGYLQVCLSMRETYPVVDYYVRRIFLGCSGAIYLFNENRTVVEPVVTWGDAGKLDKVLDPNDSWALRQGKVHEVTEQYQGMLCDFLDAHPVNGYICAPIIAQGDMIGMLHVQYDEIPKDFTPYEIDHHYQARRRLAMTTADHLALALVSLKLREALKQQSVKDPLTQLYNRRYMSDSLEREFARCRRAQWELSIILIDIDHFKSYNDEHGHDAGDLVLRELADYIRGNLRAEDIACRFGGEEFLLLLPGAKQEEARKRAEELREGIKQLTIRYQGSRMKNITVSAGIATCPDCALNEPDLFKAADKALYKAKETGRDKVCVADNERRKKSVGKLKTVGR